MDEWQRKLEEQLASLSCDIQYQSEEIAALKHQVVPDLGSATAPSDDCDERPSWVPPWADTTYESARDGMSMDQGHDSMCTVHASARSAFDEIMDELDTAAARAYGKVWYLECQQPQRTSHPLQPDTAKMQRRHMDLARVETAALGLPSPKTLHFSDVDE